MNEFSKKCVMEQCIRMVSNTIDMRMLFLLLLVVSCSTLKLENTNSEKQQSELELLKVFEKYDYYFHHIKKSKEDTLLIISKVSFSKEDISEIQLNKLKQIKLLPISLDTLYFEYKTKVVGKSYQINSTTAPMRRISKTYYSYSSLPYLIMDKGNGKD